jgi:CHAD domain-containing protein
MPAGSAPARLPPIVQEGERDRIAAASPPVVVNDPAGLGCPEGSPMSDPISTPAGRGPAAGDPLEPHAARSGELAAALPPQARMEGLLEEAQRQLPEALAGDEEGVHDLRVVLRRIRVLARELASAGGGPPEPLTDLAAGATALFRALAGIRDLDILRQELGDLAAAGALGPAVDPGLSRWVEGERARLRVGLPEAAAFFRQEVERYLLAPSPQGPDRPARAAAVRSQRRARPRRRGRRLRRPARRLLKAFDRARRRPTPERLHRLRIRGKSLRYTAEALLHEEAGRPKRGHGTDIAALESGLKKLQDALGAVQDAAMVLGRLDGLGAAGTLPPSAVGPARMAAARELERRRTAFLVDLEIGVYANLLHEVKKVAAKQGDGTGGETRDAARIPLEKIPGIGPAKARRLAEAGLASPDALKSASLEDLAAVKTIGAHQAKLIKEYVEESGNGGPVEGDGEVDGKRFERTQAVLGLGATVSDYARTLAEELSRHEEGDTVRAGRQAERLADGLSTLSERLGEVSSKRLKSLRAELRETEGLLAKVLDLETSSLKMNKLRKALKTHRRAIESYLG